MDCIPQNPRGAIDKVQNVLRQENNTMLCERVGNADKAIDMSDPRNVGPRRSITAAEG